MDFSGNGDEGLSDKGIIGKERSTVRNVHVVNVYKSVVIVVLRRSNG